MNKDLKETREGGMHGRKAFQVKGTASAKALRWGGA